MKTDDELQNDVMEVIRCGSQLIDVHTQIGNATIDADALMLEAAGKTIILRGKVKSWIEKEEAERIAWSSPGVRAIDNQIEINTEIFAE